MADEPQIVHARACRSAVRAAAELAARQFGAISRRQLLALGCTRSRIQHWLRCGRLHRRYPGVYAWGRAELGTEGELASALLVAGPGSALTSLTALWWMELLQHWPNPLHVASTRRACSRPGVAITPFPGLRRRLHRGLPVVPLSEALLAATSGLPRDSLRLVLARAEFRKLLDLGELHGILRSGRRGSRALRAAAEAHLPQLAACASELEIDFVLLCERFRLPLPEPNPRIGRYRPDMLWREPMLIVELDGRDAHSGPAQLGADARRQAELEGRGYTVIRFGWDEVHEEAERVAATVRAALGAG
jgi:hypothetical protein